MGKTIGVVIKTLFAVALSVGTISLAQTKVEIDASKTEHILSIAHPDTYTAEFKAGQFYAVTAFQEDVDLVLEVYAPDGKVIASVDSPNGIHGPEEWDAFAPTDGTFRFVVRRLDPKAPDGKYTFEIRSAQAFSKSWVSANIESPMIAKLWLDAGSNSEAVQAFMLGREGKGPLVEQINSKIVRITFLFRAPAGSQSVTMYGGPSAEGSSQLEELGDTNLWFVTLQSPVDGRFIYSFKYRTLIRSGKSWIVSTATVSDPFNPLTFDGNSSILALDQAPKQPFSVLTAKRVAKGTLRRLSIKSAILKEERTYSVYTPAQFQPNHRGKYGIMLVFDGEPYGSGAESNPTINLPFILDRAIPAKKAPPMVVVLINNMGKRNRDLPCSKPFADFVASELLPTIRRQYPSASKEASRVIVCGASFGGLCASYCALVHPETFGNVLSQSGSYWVAGNQFDADPYNYPREAYIPTQFSLRPHLPIRFYLEVGTYESEAKQLRTNRHLRDILTTKGYDVTYREYHGNHDQNYWRGSIVDAIGSLTRDWK